MNGIVRAINHTRGMVAIETDGDGFTIIELLGDEVSLDDEMKWNDATGLGGETYINTTAGEEIDVFVQNHWVSGGQLSTQLLIKAGHRISISPTIQKLFTRNGIRV